MQGQALFFHLLVVLVVQLFPNLEEVLALHNQYNQKMKERVKAGFPIGNIGDMLCEMFDGTVGDTLVKVGAEFTKRQKWSIEELKKERARDQTVELYLREQEKRPECRRLGLQALLPVEHQRLVKYPLLLESLAKYCDKESEEFAKVKRCVERSREILGTIDQQVAEAQNVQRLAELQGSIDTSGLEKMPESAICVEYRNLDLTTYRLIYDGPLTLKLGDTKRFKTIDLHVVLLEDCIMLLQKQDDKYLLKFHTSTVGNAAVGSQGHKFCHSPVIKFSAMLVRPVATDKRAFYLLNTTQNGPQIYELVASSTADRTQWFRHITEASNAYRARDTRGRGRGLYPADPINNNGLEGSGGDRSKTEVDRLDVESALDKKGQPAGRSQSFHEQSTSSREPHPERQPSSPPEERPELSSSAKKAGETENGSRKRFQRVEILKIAEPCPLIDPSQVVVTQGEILVADPVLTPIEKIRRKDQEVARALEEKHRLVAEYYHLPFDDELNPPPATPVSAGPMSAAASIDEVTSGGERDAREVLLAALVQVKSLSDLVNESLTLSEEDAVAAASVATSSRLSPSGSASTSPHQQTTTATSTSPTPTMATATGTTTTAFPRLSSLASEAIDDLPSVKLLKRLQPPTHKLIAITKSMNHHLTSLLEIIQDRDEERDRLRKEVHRMRAMLPRESAASSGSMRPSLSAAATTGPGSRPVSFISIEESSGPETTSASERNQESEDDGASNRSPTQVHPTVSENIGEDVASVERIIETTIASQDVEANPEQPPSQIGPGNTSPTTFKVPKTEANVSSNDEPEDETSEVMVENTEDDSAV